MRLTPAELAAHLRISVRQVQRLVSAGMPSIPTGARGRVYDPDACEQWLTLNPDACRTEKTQKAVTTSSFASAAAAFTEKCRLAQLRTTPSV
jgi:phage terminase Nu1 subunit (DNA packaging protein)